MSEGHYWTKIVDCRGVIDIDETVETARKAVRRASKSKHPNQDIVGAIKFNRTSRHGMIAVSWKIERLHVDVYNVISAAKLFSSTWTWTLPRFQKNSIVEIEIKDPHGMSWIASMITGPKTTLNALYDKAGLNIEEMVIQPLAISQVAKRICTVLPIWTNKCLHVITNWNFIRWSRWRLLQKILQSSWMAENAERIKTWIRICNFIWN